MLIHHTLGLVLRVMRVRTKLQGDVSAILVALLLVLIEVAL